MHVICDKEISACNVH